MFLRKKRENFTRKLRLPEITKRQQVQALNRACFFP